ncbi:hypothetical protein GALMADRAFT_154413 [Galerina marginata CBS 339.88]|uniref:Uncharacterized protein n=1 Tax=Galerina marginata (strain CBS 339.88) TaxID=685588 RepID=A0A067T8N3_GALM3|nr:hypothetical protein GALMADRAFT_154413 [Galerina marginata CBS 339.88]
MTTQILVDDSDPSIQYGPGWVGSTNSRPVGTPDLNYPMYGTLHQAVTASQLSYSFLGHSIAVCGQISEDSFQVFQDRLYLLWNCFIDNVSIDVSPQLSSRPEEICCYRDDLPAGQHSIRLSVNASQAHPVAFDYLLYTPSSDIATGDLYLTSDNPVFKYGSDWVTLYSGMATKKAGSNFTFDFYGVSILWFGFYNTNRTFGGPNYAWAPLSYSVDGGSPMAIPIIPEAGLNDTVPPEILLFQTFAHPRGQHKLEVFFDGIKQGESALPIPLTLTSLVVKNGTTNPPSTSTTATPTVTSTTTTRGVKGVSSAHLKIILGCCSVAVLAFLFLCVSCIRHRMQRRRNIGPEYASSSVVEPFHHDPSSAPIRTRQKGQHSPQNQNQPEGEVEPARVERPPSNSLMTTQILVDDYDPSIQYGPGWVGATSSRPVGTPDLNYPMYGTLHKAVTPSELSYSFLGNSVAVCGQLSEDSFQVFQDKLYLIWNCFIDNVSIDVSPQLTRRPKEICCDRDDLPDGQHSIRLSANASQEHPISFDYLLYTPSSDSDIPTADLYLTSDNPAFKYGSDWVTSYFGMVTKTPGPGSNFTFDFYGVSILWFGFYNTTFGGPDYAWTPISYSVDGESPMAIPIVPEVGLNNTIPPVQSLLFQTFAHPRGQHRLEVFFDGLQQGTPGLPIPLTLASLVVQNGTTNPPSTSTPPDASDSTAPAASTTNKSGGKGVSGAHLKIILSCCSIAVLAFILLGVFWIRRRRQNIGPKYGASESSVAEPFHHDPSSAPIRTLQKGQNSSHNPPEVEVEPTRVAPPPSYVTGLHNS